MRIITWNLKGATETRKVWDLLSKYKPDIALLQEVGRIPESIRSSFETKEKKALKKSGGEQRFSTVILVKGKIIRNLPLSSRLDWINKELKLFKGNHVSYVAKIHGYPPLNIISVHSPAWPVDPKRLKGIDVSDFADQKGKVWMTELLQNALQHTKLSNDAPWVVGGDYNASETFDSDWQDKNGKRFGIRSAGSGCKEILENMYNLGFKECLREYNGEITPTYKNPTGGKVVHQIDHLFVTNNLYVGIKNCSVGKESAVFGKSLSDHLPIIADFR